MNKRRHIGLVSFWEEDFPMRNAILQLEKENETYFVSISIYGPDGMMMGSKMCYPDKIELNNIQTDDETDYFCDLILFMTTGDTKYALCCSKNQIINILDFIQ